LAAVGLWTGVALRIFRRSGPARSRRLPSPPAQARALVQPRSAASPLSGLDAFAASALVTTTPTSHDIASSHGRPTSGPARVAPRRRPNLTVSGGGIIRLRGCWRVRSRARLSGR
jgi:hypothetical protein